MLSKGLRFSISMAIPIKVLIKETLSAPSASTALAISVIAVTLGDNFTINGQTTAVKPYDSGERYVYIEIENIPAPDLDDSYSIKVGSVDLGDISPLTYAKSELNDHTSETLTELMNALCRYHEAAKALWS